MRLYLNYQELRKLEGVHISYKLKFFHRLICTNSGKKALAFRTYSSKRRIGPIYKLMRSGTMGTMSHALGGKDHEGLP
jgi:hypothetical protein